MDTITTETGSKDCCGTPLGVPCACVKYRKVFKAPSQISRCKFCGEISDPKFYNGDHGSCLISAHREEQTRRQNAYYASEQDGVR